MRILFFGTPEFAAKILGLIAESEFGGEIVGVVTREDKPKDRGHKLTPPPVKVTAEKYGYRVFQPPTLKAEVFGEAFEELRPELCVVAAYGKILPHYVLCQPKYGALNVHGSLLPKYRGAAPIQRAIMAGERAIGITIMNMDDGIDTGDMLAKKWIMPSKEKSCGEIEEILAEKGGELLLDVMRSVGTEKYPPRHQAKSKATYAGKIDISDRILDFSKSASECADRIRALSPSPLCISDVDGMGIKIAVASAMNENPSGKAGTVDSLGGKGDGFISVNCGEGKLKILRLIPEGKGEMSAGDFVRGRKITPDSLLGGGEKK